MHLLKPLQLKLLDTDFSKYRLTHQQTITPDDDAKFHGHLCDGLVVGFLGLREAAYKIYTDSIVDGINARIVSKSSLCVTDIVICLTSGRYQFNTFYVSGSIKYSFIVQRINNGKAYGVKLKPGVKPAAIDCLGNTANTGKSDACNIDPLHQLENRFLHQLLPADPKQVFIAEEIKNYPWNPRFLNAFLKTDIVNKNIKNCFPVKKFHRNIAIKWV